MNTFDLLQAVGEASDTDIKNAETLKRTGLTRKKRIIFGLTASAAVLALILFAVPALNRKENKPDKETEPVTHVSNLDNAGVTTLTLQSFEVGENYPDFSAYRNIPLNCLEVTEGRWRKSIYMLNMASTESPSFQLIREAVRKMSQTEKIYAQISLAVRVFETEAEEDQELWVFPSFYHGGVSGIFWARIDRKASDCTIEWEMTGPEEESWVRRIDMLGELSSEESPVALVLDKNRLLAVINSQAYLLKEDPDVPYAETIDLTGVQAFDRIPEGVVWELSMKTVRKYELVRLTAEQKARYANIIYSADTDPYLEKYDLSNLSLEEKEKKLNEISALQRKASWAGSILTSNASRFSNDEQKEYFREEYGGCYITGDKLTVLLPENVPAAKEWVESIIPSSLSDVLVYRTVEYSYKELYEMMEKEVLPAFRSAGIIVYECYVSETMNRIVFRVDNDTLIQAFETVLEKGWEGFVMVAYSNSTEAYEDIPKVTMNK